MARGGSDGVNDAAPIGSRIRVEAIKQLTIALPMMGTSLVQFAMQLASVMFVGHLGELELSSASIATSIANVTGYSFVFGLASGLETLCGQAYGAKRYRLLGIYMQRGILVLTVVAIPVAFVWFHMEPILLFFGQAPDISAKAGIYTRYLIPGLFAFPVQQPLVKFLLTQSKVVPMLICSCTTLVLHLGVCWTLVYKLGLGNRGAAMAASISNWVACLLLVLIVVATPSCRRCWPGFSREAFKDIFELLKLAVPSAIMVCLEWWCFEALVLLSGILPHPQLEASVFSILLNVISFCYMATYGIGAAASTRVSNELGAGRPDAARFSFFVAVVMAATDGVLVATTLFLTRNLLGKAFSNEDEVVRYVARMVPFLACLCSMDAIQGTIAGVARGCGWQATAAIANLAAYYLIGLPIGYVLAFIVKLRGEGLLIGILAGVTSQALAFTTIGIFTNWKKQSEQASERVEHSLERSSATLPLLN